MEATTYFLAGEASRSLKGVTSAPVDQAMQSSPLEVDLPYELLLANQAVILGQHQHGRIVLALREVPSCPLPIVEKYAADKGGRQLTLLRQLVTATGKLTKALCVGYIAAAEDGLRRLYARQVSAQSLSRDARCLLYGQTHKEIDMSGAHYEILRRAWRFLDKKTDYAFVAGDFNGLDKHLPQLWEKLLLQFQCSDVHPELATYRHSRGVSCLDRDLVPDSLINSAKLYASASVLTSHVANGHDIVKIRVGVRPNVLNNPRHPKHEVIPSGVFMPGKDGTPVTSTSELQS